MMQLKCVMLGICDVGFRVELVDQEFHLWHVMDANLVHISEKDMVILASDDSIIYSTAADLRLFLDAPLSRHAPPLVLGTVGATLLGCDHHRLLTQHTTGLYMTTTSLKDGTTHQVSHWPISLAHDGGCGSFLGPCL